MKEAAASFPCGALTLEGAWHFPRGEGPFPAVVALHPHPLYGGDMDNNVVMAVGLALAEKGIAAFRLNFRGVGASQGSFAEGEGEREDVRAALDFVCQEPAIDAKRLGLAGYSFGAMVALPVAAAGVRVKALAVISLPLLPPGLEPLKAFARPKLILAGERDQFIPVSLLGELVQGLPPPLEWEVLPGADHFWWGQEKPLAQRVAAFFTRAFSTP